MMPILTKMPILTTNIMYNCCKKITRNGRNLPTVKPREEDTTGPQDSKPEVNG